MKAEEYIVKYPNIKSSKLELVAEAMSGIICDLLREVQALAKVRHANSDEASMSILKEINKKWYAILKRSENPVYDLESTQLDVFKEQAKRTFGVPDVMWD